ncbi:MAG: site-2 protease family protein, partial [Eggerthellaceae bacterium]|nr:site-2 protease family protein [Eggerthellaceae bacterium]
PENPHLQQTLAFVYQQGTVNMEDVSHALQISDDDALAALDELVEWGSITGPRKKDKYNTYRTPALSGGDTPRLEEGTPRPLDDAHSFYEAERAQQYRSLPFWKRCCILLAGPGMNLLFTIVVIVVIYSIVGVDVQDTVTGEVTHMTVGPLRSLYAGVVYIGMVLVAILGLFNPATAAETVSNSTSIVGIAVMSKSAAEAGLLNFAMFAAMISVSLGLMNLLPIPPLDGGRFVVEVIQRIRRKDVTMQTLNAVSIAGITLFVLFFLIMLNQDVQRFIFGNW